MEQWNREALYTDVWEQPLTKLIPKYGISAVALGKVCRKLKIPLPVRGYWAKKRVGQPVKRIPLPKAKDLPTAWRTKMPPPEGSQIEKVAEPEPTDRVWLRIKQVEARTISIASEAEYHKLVKVALRNLSAAKTDERGILQARSSAAILDVRVSRNCLERALKFFNAIIEALEVEGFAISIAEDKRRTVAKVFGQLVQLVLVEKTTEKGRREVKEYSWTKTVIDCEPSGKLEFRIGTTSYSPSRTLCDGKKQRIEDVLPDAIGKIMREARDLGIQGERRKQEELNRQKRAQERAKLADEINEEEKKLKQLEAWVEAWSHATKMREFISTLEEVWTKEGHDLAPDAAKGQRIAWMKRQADRQDPMAFPKPTSILDRKGELSGW
jgi:hypothetical protein